MNDEENVRLLGSMFAMNAFINRGYEKPDDVANMSVEFAEALIRALDKNPEPAAGLPAIKTRKKKDENPTEPS